jgi:hypothetical protein
MTDEGRIIVIVVIASLVEFVLIARLILKVMKEIREMLELVIQLSNQLSDMRKIYEDVIKKTAELSKLMEKSDDFMEDEYGMKPASSLYADKYSGKLSVRAYNENKERLNKAKVGIDYEAELSDPQPKKGKGK